MSLKKYQQKRNFSRTPEPRGRSKTKPVGRRFVIQKHAASRLHYDFRLEMNGTLKSWAVPKGVPYEKGEKRLAVEVEDHPIGYIDFEGTIPKGEYGGGTVMVWDHGTYEPLGPHPLKDLSNGKLHFKLHGDKLEGEWHLVRMSDKKNWLLIKSHSDAAPVSRKIDGLSVLSGRTMAEIRQGIKQATHKTAKRSSGKATSAKSKSRRNPAKRGLPEFIPPMTARLVSDPPPGDWVYEIKLDGFRALAFKNGGHSRLASRNNKDFKSKFPEILDAVCRLEAEDIILDGEIVAVDNKGRSSFQLLQNYDLSDEKPPLFYYVFDVLRFEGKDVRDLPLTERKALLPEALRDAPEEIHPLNGLNGDVKKLLREARRLGLEGLVGKRVGSMYEAGKRSGAWIKIKLLHEQEMVIGGFTEPQGGREHFGSLIVGVHDEKGLAYAGRVGTGFNARALRSLAEQFQPLGTATCPFYNLPEERSSRRGTVMSLSEMKRHCHWLKPKLVCQVKFSEWTRDAKLRHPVYLGLREDKPPKKVVREIPG